MSFTPTSKFAPGDSVSVLTSGDRMFGIVTNVKFDKYGHTYDVQTDVLSLRDVDQSWLSAVMAKAPTPSYHGTYDCQQPAYQNVVAPVKYSALAACAKANPL